MSKFLSISSKILLFLQSDPLFTPYGVIIFYSVIDKNCVKEQITQMVSLNPKRAGLFGPISQPGGADSAPPQDLGNRLTKHQVCGTSG